MSAFSSLSVLVTGGTGFIGSHLTRRLVREGARVHLLVRPESRSWRIRDVWADVTCWQGNVTDFDSVERCITGARPAVIFQVAGATHGRGLANDLAQIDQSIEMNLKGTLNVLKAAHRCEQAVQCIVRTGGLEEYGNGKAPYDEDQRESPVSAYSASQVATTHYCQMMGRGLGLPIVTLRPALTYGPAQSTSFLVPALILHCLEGRDFEMTSGEQGRDYVYVEDVVDAYLRAALTPEARGEVINIGSGREYRIRDVAERILRLTEAAIRLQTGRSPRPCEIQHLFCRIEKAARILGWSPRTALEEGLAYTIAWYREHGAGASQSQLPEGLAPMDPPCSHGLPPSSRGKRQSW